MWKSKVLDKENLKDEMSLRNSPVLEKMSEFLDKRTDLFVLKNDLECLRKWF